MAAAADDDDVVRRLEVGRPAEVRILGWLLRKPCLRSANGTELQGGRLPRAAMTSGSRVREAIDRSRADLAGAAPCHSISRPMVLRGKKLLFVKRQKRSCFAQVQPDRENLPEGLKGQLACAASWDCSSRTRRSSRELGPPAVGHADAPCATAGPTAPVSRSMARRRTASAKITVQSADAGHGLRRSRRASVGAAIGADGRASARKSTHAVLTSRPTRSTRRGRRCARDHPDVRIMGAGEAIEIYKEVGLPDRRGRALRPRRHERARTASATPAWRPNRR